MISIQDKANAEFANFIRVRGLVSDPVSFTDRFRASMESLGDNPLAKAILALLSR